MHWRQRCREALPKGEGARRVASSENDRTHMINAMNERNESKGAQSVGESADCITRISQTCEQCVALAGVCESAEKKGKTCCVV